jgi:hypothetical protein
VGLKRDPSLSGIVTLEITVFETGSVSMAIPAKTTISDHQVTRCAVDVAKRWRFPKPAATTTIELPITMGSPSDQDSAAQ